MNLYTLRNKATKKLLGVKLIVSESLQVFYSFTEDAPQFLYVHLSLGFIQRAVSPNESYDGSYLHPFWGMLVPESYEIVKYLSTEE